MIRTVGFALGMSAAALSGAAAAPAFSCGGFAMLGGAQLICSHVNPKAPPQMCTFSWALVTPMNTVQMAQGAFLLPTGVVNATVYTGSGVNGELSNPIVMCQAKKSGM